MTVRTRLASPEARRAPMPPPPAQVTRAQRISALPYGTRCSRLCRPPFYYYRRAFTLGAAPHPRPRQCGSCRHYARPSSCNPPDQPPAPAVPKAVQERILRGEFVDFSSLLPRKFLHTSGPTFRLVHSPNNDSQLNIVESDDAKQVRRKVHDNYTCSYPARGMDHIHVCYHGCCPTPHC